ncbi:urease accessory protein [Caulobacter ginsengisoli]|uniref:Urease accessory protein UreD n=1 Tax=Caulobacter ginsengisoli TaxID=400775 RepID=A0ABU0IMN0_9CAUL|nr:urease accessory protein UreD [Caulobacter ginsengisoli]MDQ0462660.1 urease accessory protein [Caulobacter ginsengisoli]
MAPFDQIVTEAPAAQRPQRAVGAGRLSLVRGAAGVGPGRLYQQGCAQIRLPRLRADHAEAILINTAGGLTGGDMLDWTVEVEAGAAGVVTTQACDKVYRSSGGVANVTSRLSVGPSARLDWIPQETILFDEARLHRRLEADVAPDGRLLVLEAVVLGRAAMGETVRQASLKDRWRIRRGGRLLFADDLVLDGAVSEIAARPSLLAGAGAFASLLLIAPDAERYLEPLRAALGAASAWGGRLYARVLAPDGFALRQALIPALQALGGPLPRIWTS